MSGKSHGKEGFSSSERPLRNGSGKGEDEAVLVSVIIVNYNGLRFLDACLASLSTAFSRYRSEIIVVDNDSTDGSREWLRSRQDIIYVESSENLGFTGGNNLGASHASGERLLFINNDTLVKTALDELMDVLDDVHVGIAGCRLRYGDSRQQFSFGYDHTPSRIVLSWLGVEKKHWLPSIFRRLETDPGKYQQDQQDVSWVSGACFVVRKEVWVALAGFDTLFFMYCEDVDLCLRARKMGLRIVYTNRCTVIHFEGAGKMWIGHVALGRTARSYQLFLRKHFGQASAATVSVLLGAVFFLRSLVFFCQSCLPGLKQDVRREKAVGFFCGAKMLLTSVTGSAMKAGNP